MKKSSGEDHLALIQDEAYKIYSSSQSAFDVSQFSFGWKRSNLDTGEIGSILGCFAINEAWRNIKLVSDRIGGGITSLKDSFANAASRRHSSAHSSDFHYQYSWLNGLPSELLA